MKLKRLGHSLFPDSASQKVNTWHVSLADLMTLMLCFFLAIVATTKPESKDKQSSGIQIAEDKTGPRKLEIAVSREWFSETNWHLTEAGLKQLKDEVTKWNHKANAVRVKWCLESNKGTRAEGEFSAMSRTMTLMGQIIDGGVPLSAITVGLPSVECGDSLGSVEFSRI